MDKKEKFIRHVYYLLSQIDDSYLNNFPYTAKKLGMTDLEYATMLANYLISGNQMKTAKLRDIVLGSGYENMVTLASDPNGIKILTKVIDMYGSLFTGTIPTLLLKRSNFNLGFFINNEELFNNREQIKDIFRSSRPHEIPEKFMLYVFSNNHYVDILKDSIVGSLMDLPPKVQSFLILEKKLPLSDNNILTILSNPQYDKLPIKIKNQIFKDRFEGRKKLSNIELMRTYLEFLPYYQKKIFKTEKLFFGWVAKQKGNDLLFKFLEEADRESVVNFLRSYPTILTQKIKDLDVLARIKYEMDDIPEDIKDNINLPMQKNIKLGAGVVSDMLYGDRDGYQKYVEYFIDDTLYEHTMHWDYSYMSTSDIDQYYWDDITEKNVIRIINKLKENGVEIDFTNMNEVKEAALEDDDISSVLTMAANDGARAGDESKLYGDIVDILNELFGKGEWVHNYENKTITVNADISDFDDRDISYVYNDCGEWDISCLFSVLKKDYLDDRNKPRFPDYRYGIQGDFDKEIFNETIISNL